MARFFYILILFLMLFTRSGLATDYYVAKVPVGNNDNTGLAGAPWATVSKVNSVNFANGDRIFFLRGYSWAETITLAGLTNGIAKTITIGAYGSGNCPWIGANVAQPINISVSGLSLALQDLDLSGQMWGSGKASVCLLDGLKNIVLDNVHADGSVGYSGSPTSWRYGPHIDAPTGTVEVKNCTFKNWGPSSNWATPSASPGTKVDYVGLVVIGARTGVSVAIHDNTIFNCESDGVLLHGCTVPAVIYRNTIYNCGENAIDTKGSDNWEIYENRLYREASYTGSGGSSWDSLENGVINVIADDSILQQYRGCANGKIRDNIIGPTDLLGIKISGTSTFDTEKIYVYRNKILGCRKVFYIGNDSHNFEIHRNLIIGAYGAVSNNVFWEWNGRGFGGKIYFNSIYEANGHFDAVYWAEVTNSEFKANAVYLNGASVLYYTGAAAPTFGQNIWYNANGTKGVPAGDVEANPLFVSSTDLTLQSNSPCIDAFDGSALVTTQLNGQGLNPAGTWDPFDLSALVQTLYGSSPYYERGAYVYTPSGQTTATAIASNTQADIGRTDDHRYRGGKFHRSYKDVTRVEVKLSAVGDVETAGHTVYLQTWSMNADNLSAGTSVDRASVSASNSWDGTWVAFTLSNASFSAGQASDVTIKATDANNYLRGFSGDDTTGDVTHTQAYRWGRTGAVVFTDPGHDMAIKIYGTLAGVAGIDKYIGIDAGEVKNVHGVDTGKIGSFPVLGP